MEAVARVDTVRVDAGAEEADAASDGLDVAFLGVEDEVELGVEELLDAGDVLESLVVLTLGDEEDEIIYIASVVFVPEVEFDETVELIEVDIGDELGGEVANHDTISGVAGVEAFLGWEIVPLGNPPATVGFVGGVVHEDLAPKVIADLVKLANGMVAHIGSELLLETPFDAFVELDAGEGHKIAFDVEFEGVGGNGAALADAAHHLLGALDAERGAFEIAATVSVETEMTIPPIIAHIVEEMVHNAVDEGGGENFPNHRIVNDKRHGAMRLVIVRKDGVGEADDILGPVDLVLVFVEGLELIFAGLLKSLGELQNEPLAKTEMVDFAGDIV